MNTKFKTASASRPEMLFLAFFLAFFSVSQVFCQLPEMEFLPPETSSGLHSTEIDQSKLQQQKKVIVDLFSFLDEYELHFREMKYLNILGKLPELKTSFQQAEKVYRRYEPKMVEELKIMGSLYFARYQLFAGMGDIIKNLRIDSGFRAAILRSGTVVLSNYNLLLDKIRESPGMNQLELAEFKLSLANVTRRNQKYSITSKYLNLDDNKIPQGEKVIVLEIKGNKALVLYMGPTMTNSQIEAWISLRDLEKRTDWQKSNQDYFALPSKK